MLATTRNTLIQLAEIQHQLQTIHEFFNKWQTNPREFKEEYLSEKVLVRFLKYETESFANREWEAHRKEIDLHIILQGSERIYLEDATKLTEGIYHEKEDYYLLEGPSNHFITLSSAIDQENSLFLWPTEAHKTGVNVTDEAVMVKKMVFKIKY